MKYVLRKSWLLFICILLGGVAAAQPSPATDGFIFSKTVPHTAIKDQANSNTCWSFSVTSLIESQSIRNGYGSFDISEMFTVRNIYLDKAKNYILRQGKTQFGPGGLGHDVISAMDRYGAVPESIYSGLVLGKRHDHNTMDGRLKLYLDSLLTLRPLPNNWMEGFKSILDDCLGRPPETFTYNEKIYTPLSFAREVLHFRAQDYVSLTSFTHHPFYTSFILEVPDNFQNKSFFNIPIEEMIRLTERSLELGYSVMWDADVSNQFFRQREGYAMVWKNDNLGNVAIDPDAEEIHWDEILRQSLFENLTTQDDHLMHIVGIKRSAGGKKFFIVKNSWGEAGPFKGFINVSETYFAVNTISVVIPKASFDRALITKLGIQ